jgi:hypothetical protein
MSEEDVFISEGSGSTQGRMGAATDGAEVGGGVHGCVGGDAVMALFEGKLLNQSETVGKREEGSASGEALMRESSSWCREAGHIM